MPRKVKQKIGRAVPAPVTLVFAYGTFILRLGKGSACTHFGRQCPHPPRQAEPAPTSLIFICKTFCLRLGKGGACTHFGRLSLHSPR